MHLSEVRILKSERLEYLLEEEGKAIKESFARYLNLYKEKEESTTDKEWLEQLFRDELPQLDEEEIKRDSLDIIESIEEFDKNLESVNDAATQGISKERWLANRIQETSIGMSINEYGQLLQVTDDYLYHKNIELAEALKRSSDGNIKMNPNLDGNIAEYLIAKTTELSGFLQDKDIKVEVRDVFTKNSVDVRATNIDTGEYQNFQLKFGKNAKATIELIERGNYNNQQIIVPTEQVDEIKEYFKSKGSSKTITDHINAWGAEGKKFTKEDVKVLQLSAQEDGIMPSMNYNHYQTKDIALSIGKNASAMGLQVAAVTTGLEIANSVFKGEELMADEIVEAAIRSGTDTSIKVVTAGTLQVAVRKEIIKFIPPSTPAGVIANIACVGIENTKILGKIAMGDLSITKGLDQMGRVTTSMIGGLWSMGEGAIKGTIVGGKIFGWIPVIGVPLAVATGFVGGMVGYFGGSKIGDAVYSIGKKIAGIAKDIAKVAISGLSKAGKAIGQGISSVKNKILGIFIW